MTPALPGPHPGVAVDQVETTLFRALAVLRGVVLLYTLVVNVVRWDEFARPGLAGVVIGGIVLWSGFVTWAYDEPRRRRLPLLVADLAVAAAALLSTPLVQGDAMLERHASSVPSFWVMAAVLAWAAARGWVAGVVAAGVVSACDLSVRLQPTGTTWGNIFLLFLAGSVVGYSASRLREATEARAQAERQAAGLEERARLARIVHDGVLQVLALVQRRGLELGGDAAELGRLAGEQEVRLRTLVHGEAVTRSTGPVTGPDVDLVEKLALRAPAHVRVSGPGTSVVLPAPVAEELAAAVQACLDNVARHVGERAPAWVLVEDLGDSVMVTVRDEGPGIPEGRLATAEAEGRMGVSGSIRARLADLGGTAVLVTAAGAGTEWELTVPRGG